MALQENSPGLPGRGLKGILAKARRNKADNSSTTSFNGTEGSNESYGIRDSMDNALDKLKSVARGDNDNPDSPGIAGIAKLIPRGRKKREKKRRALEEEDAAEGPRGRTMGEDPTRPSVGSTDQSAVDDDEESSLMTDDSGEEEHTTKAPPLLSHPSHIGYLTSSSPTVKATALSDSSSTGPLVETSVDPVKRSALASSATNLATGSPITPGPFTGESTLSVDSLESHKSSQSRSISPGFRLKDALKSGSRKNSTQNGSPDRGSISSFGGGSTLGGLFSKDRRGSLSSRRASKVPSEAPLVPTAIQTINTEAVSSNKNLPSLMTTPSTPPPTSLTTPLTTVTPPTPVDRDSNAAVSKPSSIKSEAASVGKDSSVVNSPSGNVISHRRGRSDSSTHQPSKLSNAMSAPLTPMMEETKPTGSRNSSGNAAQSTGFFSSVFVAAQNAANTLSNTIQNNQTRSRSNTEESNEKSTNTATTTRNAPLDNAMEKPKEQAIHTIGTGDLNMSHLGISTDALSTTTTGASPVAATQDPDAHSVRSDEASARAENISAARAVSAAYADRSNDGTTPTPVAEDVVSNGRPKSAYEASISGDKTPPNGSIFESESGGPWRNGSLRSKVGKVKRRRNNSGATGTTIGAAIAASHSTLMSPGANSSVPKLTGFAVASKKRNRDFHQLFRSVPEDDYLIEDYSCALQRDIILAGRIYVSEGHICFSSNILGWITTLVISFDEVVSIEKETTAMVFPNAIAIQTLQARHTFRSLLSREATYDLLVGIWRISHPSLQSSENGVKLINGGTGSKTEKVEPSESEDGSDGSDEEEEVYDEDDDDDEGGGSFVETVNGSVAGSEAPEAQPKAVARKASAMGVAAGQATGTAPVPSEGKSPEKVGAAGATAAADFPGPPTHAPTECADSASHYDKLLKDEVIPAPLGKIYSMLFGPASILFVKNFLLDEVKGTELQLEEKALTDENKSRSYSYIKPLNAPIGPKQTKCITTEILDFLDLEKSVSVTVTTQTPDVPSGNVFSTKTKYCIMWGPNNGTRLIMNCTTEWTGKSWLKGPIEKGANDGQTTYANDLVRCLRAGLSTRPRAGTSGSRMKKGRKRKSDGEDGKTTTISKANDSASKLSDWGLFEPLHAILSPVADLLQPLLTSQSIIGFLIFLLIISWFRNSRLRVPANTLGTYPAGLTPQRMAAYEEMWRAEESALWEWLEQRVGMSEAGGLAYPANPNLRNGDGSKRAKGEREGALRGRAAKEKLEGAKRMGEREVEWAIGTTEEKLRVLKGVVERAKEAVVESVGGEGQERIEEGEGEGGDGVEGEVPRGKEKGVRPEL